MVSIRSRRRRRLKDAVFDLTGYFTPCFNPQPAPSPAEGALPVRTSTRHLCFNPQPAPSPAEGSVASGIIDLSDSVSIRSRRRRRLKGPVSVAASDSPDGFQSAAGAVAG